MPKYKISDLSKGMKVYKEQLSEILDTWIILYRPKDSDMELMDFCDANGILYQIVYTKKDKKVREEQQVELSHKKHGAMIPEILETSAEKKTGLDDLRKIIGIK